MAMKLRSIGTGLSFTKHQKKSSDPLFERLFEIFKELITHTSGDFDEAIDWLRELDKDISLQMKTIQLMISLKTCSKNHI